MISTVLWVNKSQFSTKPKFYSADSNHVVDSGAEIEEISKTKSADNSGLPMELNMDNYDDEHAQVNLNSVGMSKEDLSEAFSMNMNLAHSEPVSAEDIEEFTYGAADSILLVANASVDEGFSTLEVQVYDNNTGSLFVHHDIALPHFPLSLSHIPPTSQNNNLVAVGTFGKSIELWDLDVINIIEPTVKFGAETDQHDLFTHTNSVLTLDTSSHTGLYLASGSADTTVRLWDISEAKGIHCFNHLKEKVMRVQFSPSEKNVLLTSTFEGQVGIVDIRSSSKNECGSSFDINDSSSLTSCCWSEHNPFQMLFGFESGDLAIRDLRKTVQNILKTSLHTKSVSSISFNKRAQNIFATSSFDEKVSIWDITKLDASSQTDNAGHILTKKMALGKIFDVNFALESETMLAAGGEEGVLAVWEFSEETEFKQFIDQFKG